VLNVVYPLVPDELLDFCRGKRAVLMVEEGQPNYLEDALHAILRKAGCATRLHGKDIFPMAGEYTGEVLVRCMAEFIRQAQPQALGGEGALQVADAAAPLARAQAAGRGRAGRAGAQPSAGILHRLPRTAGVRGHEADAEGTGRGPRQRRHRLPHLRHAAALQHGQHGAGLRAGAGELVGHRPLMGNRVVSIMGDGGFWHNGFTSGVVNAVYNQQDSVLVILKNGYTSATGTQDSVVAHAAGGKPAVARHRGHAQGRGRGWVRKVTSYNVARCATRCKRP
jgi:indolepyruvate ferredoxin oxidoreductase alpha subunit